LGKQYEIGAILQRDTYPTLRQTIARAMSWGPMGSLGVQRRNRPNETIWALRDVSFEISSGEAVGVIGGNGAGKSTLLKILSRITDPSEGYAEIHGRVGSLLEVGTGFHAELTGRENIYLNGAVLGMRRVEVERKFDEIVAFAELERFIDTSVKHYSSGMFMRLAFAVAAHLDTEVVLVDEVLAVGDAVFQKKCLGKMGDVAKKGRTVLFVSHSMGAIKKLCSRAMLFRNGNLVIDDDPGVAVERYLSAGVTDERTIVWDAPDAPRTQEMILRAIRIVDKDGRVSSTLSTSEPIVVELEYDLLVPARGMRIHIKLLTHDGIDIFSSSDLLAWVDSDSRPPGHYLSKCVIPGHLLNIGTYILSVGADIPRYKELLEEREYLRFVISELRDNPMGFASPGPKGIVNPMLDWSVHRIV